MTRVVIATAFGDPSVLDVVDETVAEPGVGEVVIDVRAIGVNPFDYKQYSGAFGTDESTLPLHLGSEAAGVVTAVGEDAVGPAGPVSVGDEVIVSGGASTYRERLLVHADNVLPKPANLSFDEASGLMAVAVTAVDMLEVVDVKAGDTVLVHGAAGGVGSIAVQLAKARGAIVIGTARETNHDALRALGAIPVSYGDGLLDRVKAAAPNGIDAAIDCVGTDEAIDVSLELLSDKARLVTIAAFGRAAQDGFTAVGGGDEASAERRKNARLDLVAAAAAGDITVTVAKTFPLEDVAAAHEELMKTHPRGKFVLTP